MAQSVEPEPELEPELAGFRLLLVGLPVQDGSRVPVGGLERRAGRWWEGLFRFSLQITMRRELSREQFLKEEAAPNQTSRGPGGRTGPFSSHHLHPPVYLSPCFWISAKDVDDC